MLSVKAYQTSLIVVVSLLEFVLVFFWWVLFPKDMLHYSVIVLYSFAFVFFWWVLFSKDMLHYSNFCYCPL